jgi:hypothetical protein
MSRKENIYCDINGKIFNILKYFLHESLICAPMTILIILFCSLKILLLHRGISQENNPVIHNSMEVRMVNHLQGFLVDKRFNGSNYKTSHT